MSVSGDGRKQGQKSCLLVDLTGGEAEALIPILTRSLEDGATVSSVFLWEERGGGERPSLVICYAPVTRMVSPNILLETLRSCAEECVGIPVVLITDIKELEILKGHYQEGVRAVIPDYLSVDVVEIIIRLVLRGGVFVPHQLLITPHP